MTTLINWYRQNPLTAAAVVFGGAAIAVMVYTYIVDYFMVGDGR